MKKYAIIGFGCAGFNAARAIRYLDPDGLISVFGDTSEPPFNPMLSTYYASERLEENHTFPFGNLDEIQRDLSLDLHPSTRVSRIDTAQRVVVLEDGSEKQFDSILIATGASALVPGPLRQGGGSFFLMRTLDDARRIHEYLENHQVRRAVVVGASMVGIKVGELLHRRGIQTTMVDGAEYLFPLAAYRSTAQVIQERLEKQGLGLIFNAQVAAIKPEGVALADGRLIEADLVCLCIGVRANLGLVANTQTVEGQGLNINRGIVVDAQMQTNLPGIYAAGDCCEGTNLQTGKTAIIGLWANAGAQGTCAGRNMAGVPSYYYGNILHNITHFFDMDFIGLGDPTIPGEHYKFEHSEYTIEVVMDEDVLCSVNIFGNYKISGVLRNHLSKRLLSSNAKLTIAQQGLLAAQGIDRAFIDLIGGGNKHR